MKSIKINWGLVVTGVLTVVISTAILHYTGLKDDTKSND